MKGFDKASMVRRNKLIKNLPKHDIGVTPILNSLPAATGLYGAVSERGSYSGPQGGDMMGALAPKNTAYTVGGASYTEVGNPNYGELMRQARMRDKAEKKNTVMSGVQLGAALGSAAGLPGAILGAAGGFIVGNILGLGSDEEDETRRRIEENKLAITGANSQNESVSATLGMQDEYNKSKKIVTANLGATPNGLVTGGETQGHTKMKNGKRVVTDWKTYPETPVTPKGVDNIKTHIGEQDVIFGNLYDFDGKQISTKAKEITSNPVLSNSEKSDMLTDLMYEQKIVQDLSGHNNMRKNSHNDGKSIAWLSTVPGLYQMFNAIKRKEQVEAEPRVAENPYRTDPTAQMYLNNLFDILPNLGYNKYGNKTRRNSQALYDINSRPLSPGERNAMLNQYYVNQMYGDADLAMQLYDTKNNLYRDASKTGLSYRQADQQLQFRGEQDRIKQSQDINKAYWINKLTEDYNKEQGLNSSFGNLITNLWTNKNIGLYEQPYKPAPVDFEQINKQMTSGFRMPTLQKNVPTLEPKKPMYKANRQELDDLYNWFLSRNPNILKIS